jgi:hypothetical protein
MSALQDLTKCGDIQRQIFYTNFLIHNRVGEMICVNDEESGDSFIFERWQIHGVNFVACFRLLSEDSLISSGVGYSYSPHEVILQEKTAYQRVLYTQFLEKLQAEGKSLAEIKRQAEAQGKDSSLLDFKEYTREMLEEKLPPGKKTIQGDRNTTIEVLERQKEIPNDLQRARLNRYFLDANNTIQTLLDLTNDETLQENIDAWKHHFLVEAPRTLPLSTTLPFLSETIEIRPQIFEFPAKEMLIE